MLGGECFFLFFFFPSPRTLLLGASLMASRRGASRKKARSTPATDDRPVHELDVLFQPTALPKHLHGLTQPELYLTSSASAAAQARMATKALFDYGA